MSRRQLSVILGVLAGLSLLWLGLRERGVASAGADELDLAGHVGPEVSRVTVRNPADSTVVRLRLEQGAWTVNGYPANDSLANTLADALRSVPPAPLVARSETNHVRLGVADRLARLVEIGPAGNPTSRFLLGASGPEGRFVRLPETPEVYVVDAGAVQDLDRSEFRWRDAIIASVDTAALSRVVVYRGAAGPVEITREPGEAWLVGEAPADTARMRLFLETLERFEANGFPADSFVFAVDFDRPDAVLELHRGTDPTGPPPISLLFASLPDRAEVLVRRADDPIAYAIDQDRANLLTAGRSRWVGRR